MQTKWVSERLFAFLQTLSMTVPVTALGTVIALLENAIAFWDLRVLTAGEVSRIILNVFLLIFLICQIMFGWPERWSSNTFSHFELPYILSKKKRTLCYSVFRVFFSNQFLDKIAFLFIAKTSRWIFFYTSLYILSKSLWQKNYVENIANIINKQQ